MAEKPDSGALKNQNAAIIDEFRANGGKVGGPFEGANLLLLTTTGAKSGQQRLNPTMYFPVDGKIFVVGSYAGADVDPAWVHNLRANPRAHIEVGTDSFDVTARELPPRSATSSTRRSSKRHRASATTRRRPAASSRCSNCRGPEPAPRSAPGSWMRP